MIAPAASGNRVFSLSKIVYCMTGNMSSENLNILQVFSANVRRLRKSRGMTQSELAKKIGADPTILSKRLSGKSALSAVVAVAIADELDTPLDVLFGRDSGKTTAKIRELASSILELTGGLDEKPRKSKTGKPKYKPKAKKKKAPKS